MKKPKVVKPFSFRGMSHQQMVDRLNVKYPISLKHNEDLVNRIYAKYPLIDKSHISLVVKGIFQSFRDLLILGRVLNFNNLFFDTKLHFYKYRSLPSLKVKISTPPPVRRHDKES